MSTQFYVSGPAQIYTGTGTSNAYQCIGYSESGVSISGTFLDEDVPADYAGLMPADIARLGLQMQISFTLSRYDEAVYKAAIQSIPGSAVSGSIQGNFGLNELGTLLIAEGHSYPLAIYSPYVVKSAFSGSMIPWFVFGAVRLSDSWDVTMSIRNKRPSMSFTTIPIFGNAPFNTSTIFTNVAPSPAPTPT